MRLISSLVFSLCLAACAHAAERPEAILVVAGDMHSAYDRTAQFVARVDRVRTENPGVPLAVLIDGDTFELGNAVAKRSAGAVEFAMFTALAHRAPTIVNLGNHEPEFYDLADTVARLQTTGVVVLGGNLFDKATGRPFAPASTPLKLGAHTATVVGVTTDRLSTFRVAVRPSLDLADPVVWATKNFPALLQGAALPIVMTHTGLKADRAILPLVPDGTLFVGAHDHLRFVHREGRTAYFHSGSWTEFVSIVRLHVTAAGPRWDVEQIRLAPEDPADEKLAALIRATFAQHLSAEETAVVGRAPRALGPTDAALFAVAAARRAAGADFALIGATTFGAGLPAGQVSRFALDACVRFDGTLFTAEVDGAWLKKLLARCNQGPDTPWTERAGENLVAAAPATIEPGRRYRFVTTDWVAKNAKNYLGDDAPALTEQPALKLKAAVISALR
ncbi:MAG: 5'-nucleotidase C-terminal domain-containing protein [Verrucomicrobia bacterium]|nr:5'-nucleotidase C-terminal domain-containing protein [Verrucomicrobiota bacterium]